MTEPTLTDEQIEIAYDQTRWASNMQEVLARYAAKSEVVRARLGTPQRFSYGTELSETLDFFQVATQAAPVVVLVHGGGWRGGSAVDYAFPADMFVDLGIHYVAVDFSTVMEAEGELSVLTNQISRAIGWVHQNCHQFGGDNSRLFLIGHSSGAHLAAMALADSSFVRGALLVSGIYDLAPLRRTSRTTDVNLGDAVERELSPIRRIAEVSADVLIAVGTAESPEFVRQAESYAAAMQQAGKATGLLRGEGCNHFEILETLASPSGFLGAELLRFIGEHG